jgi:hypothetical protein
VGFPDGFLLQFTGVTTPFTAATLGAVDGVAGFGAANLSLDSAGFLTLDLSNTAFRPNGSVQVQIDQTAAVPEPATWALMILGFAAVGQALRRRKVALPVVARA